MTIECLDYKTHESGALKGFGNFRMTLDTVNGPLKFELFGCGVFMKDGKRWIAMPSRKYEENNEQKFISIFRFCEKNHTDGFCKGALQALDIFCAKGPSVHEEEPVENECPF